MLASCTYHGMAFSNSGAKLVTSPCYLCESLHGNQGNSALIDYEEWRLVCSGRIWTRITREVCQPSNGNSSWSENGLQRNTSDSRTEDRTSAKSACICAFGLLATSKRHPSVDSGCWIGHNAWYLVASIGDREVTLTLPRCLCIAVVFFVNLHVLTNTFNHDKVPLIVPRQVKPERRAESLLSDILASKPGRLKGG